MQAWSQFYSVTAGAAATLLGLLFVAASINAPAALGPEEEISRRLTEQAFQNYLAVMLVSLLALFPNIDPKTFGTVVVLATAGWSVWVVIRFSQTVFRSMAWPVRLRSARRHLSAMIGFGIMLWAALRLALGWGEDFNWMAAAMLVLMISSTTVSWTLLTRFAKAKPG